MAEEQQPTGPRLLQLDDSLNPYADGKMHGHDSIPPEKLGNFKVFTIPECHGGVTLYGPEMAVINTPAFQRLGFIKQLGTSYVVFRGAVHTRFEHSLGSLYMADKIFHAARRSLAIKDIEAARAATPGVLDPSAHRLARLAGLLHDVVHVPFGHTLEDEFGLLRRHDENSFRFAKFLGPGSDVASVLLPILGQPELDELIDVLRAKDDVKEADASDDGSIKIEDLPRPFLADIMGNTVCADILDYVRRDLAACGLEVALGERFLSYFTVTSDDPDLVPLKAHRGRMALMLDKRGMPRPDVESEVIKLLTFRYELAERVYFHHAKNAASVMIARAVQAMGLATGPSENDGVQWDTSEDANFHSLSDDLLLRVLSNPSIAQTFGVTIPQDVDPPNLELAARLATGVLERSVYKLVYLAVRDDLLHRPEAIYSRYGSPSERTRLENLLAAKAGLQDGEVLVHLPPKKMMRKRADVRVMLSDRHRTVTTLDEWDELHSQRIQSLNSAHERLWRIGVYVEPTAALNLSVRRLVQAAAEDQFGARSRYQAESEHAYIAAAWDAISERRHWTDKYRSDVLLEIQETAAWTGLNSLEEVAALFDRLVQKRNRKPRRSKKAGKKPTS
jgi:HD superfamily phosphohydrolase